MTTYVKTSIVSKLNQKMMDYAQKPYAVWVFALISFCESSFFPLPPDLLMIPMLLADRAKAWWLAFLGTVTSVLGGILGYAIGYYLFESIGQWILETYNLGSAFAKFQQGFDTWGFWVIALKGLTPLPYKIVTIASGVAHFDFYQFVMASVIARAFRFYLLAALLYRFGPWAKPLIDRHLGWVLGVILLALLGGFLLLKVM